MLIICKIRRVRKKCAYNTQIIRKDYAKYAIKYAKYAKYTIKYAKIPPQNTQKNTQKNTQNTQTTQFSRPIRISARIRRIRDVIEPAKECPGFFRKKGCASDSDD